MKKKTIMLILMLGLLLIGVNGYASGDLQVNGNMGLGTTPNPNIKLDVVGDVNVSEVISSGTVTERIMNVYGTADGTYSGASLVGFNAIAKSLPSTTADLTGFSMQAQHETDQDSLHLKGGYFLIQYRSDSPTNITDSIALHILHSKSQISEGATTVANGYGLLSEVKDETSLGTLSFTNYRHIYMMDVNNSGGSISINNLSGLWIEKQTLGTNNYGIVLDGDGTGSDIVFGANQEASIYASAGELFAKDGLGNVTQISPHDTDTGEWVFYSKNVKTGRTVKVNMEKLVKAVEKLTGETFMVETLIQE